MKKRITVVLKQTYINTGNNKITSFECSKDVIIIKKDKLIEIYEYNQLLFIFNPNEIIYIKFENMED